MRVSCMPCVSCVVHALASLTPDPHSSHRPTVSGQSQERPPAVRIDEQTVARHHTRCPHATHCPPRAGTLLPSALPLWACAVCVSCHVPCACCVWPTTHPLLRLLHVFRRKTYKSISMRAPRWASGRTIFSASAISTRRYAARLIDHFLFYSIRSSMACLTWASPAGRPRGAWAVSPCHPSAWPLVTGDR
jgi:hypothetical protein